MRDLLIMILASAAGTLLSIVIVSETRVLFAGVHLVVQFVAAIFLAALLTTLGYAAVMYKHRPIIRAFGKKSLLISSAFSFVITLLLMWVGQFTIKPLVASYPELPDIVVLAAVLYGLVLALIGLVLSYLRITVNALQCATTATGIVFRQAGEGRLEVLLVLVDRFPWWLPPGGHFEWGLGESPREAAEAKVKIEAGVVVEFLNAQVQTPQKRQFDQLDRFEQPHFLYWLDVPRRKCHSKHLDFCYTFTLKKEVAKGSKEKIWVPLTKISFDDIEHALRHAIRRYYENEGHPEPRDLFPHDYFPYDLPYRIESAAQLLGMSNGGTQLSGAPLANERPLKRDVSQNGLVPSPYDSEDYSGEISIRSCCFNVRPDAPRRACWLITLDCNQHCHHCAQFANNTIAREFAPIKTKGDIASVISKLQDKRIEHVVVSGGEPTTSPFIEDIVAGIVLGGMTCSVSTNALSIEKEMFEKLKVHGLGKVTVSLDGATPQTHEGLRGSNSFAKTIEGITLLKSLGFSITIAVLIHADVLKEINLLPRLCRSLGIDSLDFIAPIKTSYCSGLVDDLPSAEVSSRTVESASVFNRMGIIPRLALPDCASDDCPSGSEVFGVAGTRWIPKCVFK